MKWLRIMMPAWICAALCLRADPGDVENSHDYPSFPRMPGYLITDFTEDSPADFDFPISRPLPDDADHIEMIHVIGHRYAIRYEFNSSQPHPPPAPTLLETQEHYEKAAAAAGFTAEKTGAVGDVTETFHANKGGRDIWVYFEPSIRVNALTIVEAKGKAPAPPLVAAAAPAPSVPVVSPPLVRGKEDPFYTALMTKGRVVLSVAFLPGKPDLDADSQPVIDRVVAMMKAHPDLMIEIDGHTDDTGDAAENRQLSENRARTVRAMIVAEHIAKTRLTAVGLGGSKPIADNETAEGREKNRRIELVIPQNSSTDDANSSSGSMDTFEGGEAGFHSTAPDGVNYYPSRSTPGH
ncbi:MAG: OmpA family protein [Methylacidiphilales bacterium]|nr:OmpA family protein [Candidatus Methylacidiphilales bacterium]